MPGTASVTPDPATLPPVSSIDVKAAYRVRAGRVSRAILFLYRYFPLTITYSFYAEFVFIGEGLAQALIALGIIGDLIRFRLAPDLQITDAVWVGLFCDGKWDAQTEHAFSRWYCGWEKPFIIGSISYVGLFWLSELFLPADVFDAYLRIFAPLHNWTLEHLKMAGTHSADLRAHGYEHRIGFLLHVELVMVIVGVIAPFFICTGGNTWMMRESRKFHQTKKNISEIREKAKKGLLKKKLFAIIAVLAFISGISMSDLGFINNISWSGCGWGSFCPHISYIYVLIFFFIKSIIPLYLLSFIIVIRNIVLAFAVRVKQECLGANGGYRVC